MKLPILTLDSNTNVMNKYYITGFILAFRKIKIQIWTTKFVMICLIDNNKRNDTYSCKTVFILQGYV